jgi:site-specific DNA-methyltransferase (adenine-specific)
MADTLPIVHTNVADAAVALPKPAFHDPKHHLKIYQGDCLRILAAIPADCVDLIFADPPYFLSNDGITCQAGKMVSVNKGKWDKSQGADLDHEFNRTWLAACQRVLKPNGSIWVSGTSHVIHSVGFAMQQLGFRLLNDISWIKPNPPPNLSCRYFTHATETLIWAAKNKKSKHTFNYKLMREINGGKQMKSAWTLGAPSRNEKRFGKHPTQKPVALLERIVQAASNAGDVVLDPFMGGGTTAVAAVRLRRATVGIEFDAEYAWLGARRMMGELLAVVVLAESHPPSLDVGLLFMDRSDPESFSHPMAPLTKLVQRECRFYFIGLSRREVIFTIQAISLDEAWQAFHNCPKSAESIFSVIKTETEIYLAQ